MRGILCVGLLLYCFCYGQNVTQDYMSLKELPGMDTLGWGIDFRLTADPKVGLKLPLFRFQYKEENQTYTYPLYPQYVFRHPDRTFVRTAAKVETEAFVSNSTTEEKNNLQFDLGISAQFQDTQGLFTGDVELNYEGKSLNTGNFLKVKNRLRISYWQLHVGPGLPRLPSVQRAMDNLELLDPTNVADLLQFIDRYGTHYLDSVMVGGVLEMNTLTKLTASNNTQQLKALANAAFTNMFGIDKGNLTLDASYNSRLSKFQVETTNRITTSGGNYSLSNFFEGNKNPKDTYEQWISQLIVNPVPIRVRAFPIWTIFDEPTMRDRMRAAMLQYLQGATPLDSRLITFLD